MGFTWHVQPYRWLYQVAEQYTKTVMIAGRKRAYANAKEAQEWMRSNAPWRDRTESEKVEAIAKDIEFGRKRSSVPYPPGARAGLRAFVSSEASELKSYDAGIKLAQAQDRATFGAAQRERTKLVSRETRKIRSQVESGKIGKQEARSLVQQIKRDHPAINTRGKDSAVFQFKKQFRSEQIPLVDITFSHHPRVWYARYLEIANGGRYSIIDKTIDRYAGKFMAEMKRIANLKQYRDRLTIGPEISPEQVFENVAHREQFGDRLAPGKGRQYEPWSPVKKKRRKERRGYYDPDKAREYYLRRLQEENEGITNWVNQREREEKMAAEAFADRSRRTQTEKTFNPFRRNR